LQAFKKISALFLAILVMYSSTSYALNMHFCMGELADIALFDSGDACIMDVEKPTCHQNDERAQIESKSCCADQSFQIEAQNELVPVVKSTLSPIQFIQIALIVSPELLATVSAERNYLYQYTPPLIVKDISILHDTFLI
jgi:hypothetical protein